MEITHHNNASDQIHIVGCGDIGRRLARLCLAAEIAPIAWVRTAKSLALCQHLGLKSQKVDFDQPFDVRAIKQPSKILYTVPPPPHGTKDSRLGSFLAQLDSTRLDRFVLISTTGVYGDRKGKWVDETTSIRPKAERALRRASAEHILQKWAAKAGVNANILRVPGIYAKDRLPIKRLKSGAPVIKQDQAPWTNRIHADDLAHACFAALHAPISGEVINIADDSPSSMTDYFRAVADYAGLPYPPEISMQAAREQMSTGMLSYLAESRRIRNDKMKRLLHIRLRYPSLAQGLA